VEDLLVYLDDVIVFSSSRQAHLEYVHEALTLLGNSGLSLKLTKCHFFSDTVDYLRHVIRPGRLGVAEKNTTALGQRRYPVLRPNYDLFWVFATSIDGLFRTFSH
jgi:Reverse transcriptase (RNA-dependent DNA polymerase)